MDSPRLLDGEPADDVVLLDDDGAPVGRAARSTVHTATTPLHLAFSCYLVRPDGAVLLTRRALTKRTWPGVWTNAFCGHPRPGEDVVDAVARHACHELGLTVPSAATRDPERTSPTPSRGTPATSSASRCTTHASPSRTSGTAPSTPRGRSRTRCARCTSRGSTRLPTRTRTR